MNEALWDFLFRYACRITGLGGIIFEVVTRDNPREIVLLVFGGLCGLPWAIPTRPKNGGGK